jgi:hypothetical protein
MSKSSRPSIDICVTSFEFQPMKSLRKAGSLLWLAAWLAAPLVAHGQRASTPSRVAVSENYGKLPLSFESNQGQSDPQVKFLSQGNGYSLFLTDSSAVLALTKQDAINAKSGGTVVNGPKAASVHQVGKTDVVRMELAGASRDLHVTGADQLPGMANYLIGNDPAKWHSGVPTYAKVQYTGVYPGIDLVYYGSQRQLEYDFVIAPGASPKPIRLQFAGARKLKLTADGDLTVAATNGEIAFHKPVIYQLKDGRRQPVEGRFSLLAKNAVGFTLGQYDHAKPLVIDPVLVYSTYLGVSGTGSYSDNDNAMAVDSSGDAYVTGFAYSTNFPVTPGAFQTVNNAAANGQTNVFVTKLNPTGTALLYSTYLGGNGMPDGGGGDSAFGIAVDSLGDAYVVGQAISTNFPVTPGAFQTAAAGSANAFVTKLNPTGTALLYSTYLSGNTAFANIIAYGIAVDSSGDAYVVGLTSATDFPVTPGAFQTVNNAAAGFLNAFVTKFNPTGTALLYSTYLGGTDSDSANGVAVDSSGDAYVTGQAASTNFPVTPGAFQTVNNAPSGSSNAFVTKLNPTGTALLYSTYLGGNGMPVGGGSGFSDYGESIAVDSSGDAYVTGGAGSTNFPVTPSAFQTVNNAAVNGQSNAFVTKFNPTGTALLYSTYLGGNGTASAGDAAVGIAVDSSGDAYVTGGAVSTNFPVTPGAFQTVNNAAVNGQYNAFVTKLNPTGTALLYSTYLGGSGGDGVVGIAVDSSGDAYVNGDTLSTNFPVTPGAFQTVNNAATGFRNAFIAKLNLSATTTMPTVKVTPSASSITTAQALTVTVAVNGTSGSPIPTGSVTLTSGAYTSEETTLSSGSATIDVPAGSLATGTDTLTATYTPDSNSSSTYDSSMGTNSVTVMASIATAPAVTLSPTNLTFASQVDGITSAAQTVTLTNSGTAALVITSIVASGDFAQTNTCGTSVTASASCTISVTFTPTAAGSRTGALAITDNASGSPQTVALSGGGETVSVTSSSTGLTIASAGGSATATISLSPQGGFTGTVNLTCAVSYQGQGTPNSPPTCSLSPSQAQVTGTSSASSTLTVSTTAVSATAALDRQWRGTGFALATLIFLGVLPRRRWRGGLLAAVLSLIAIGGVIGCSGSNGVGTNSTPPSPSGTTTGNYQVMVTATSGTATASTTIPLSLQ